MAKRKRLSPALLGGGPDPSLTSASETENSARPPIAHVAADAANEAALAELSHVLTEAREEGRLIQKLPLEAIVMDHLIRDRVEINGEDMFALKQSLEARGQQVPIEVVTLEETGSNPRYGLISGMRRVLALQELEAETVLALVRAPKSSREAYIAMVEENEIRAAVSYYERGRLAHEAVAAGLYEDQFEAIRELFAHASRAKRSKIGSFMTVHAKLGDLLRFPSAIPERLGLRIAYDITEPGVRERLREALSTYSYGTPEAEREILEEALSPPKPKRRKRAKVAPQRLSNGVQATRAKGRLTLSGAALTPELQSEIIAWIEARSEAAET